MKMIIILCFFFSSSWAQYSEQPKKENNEDIRSQSVLFSVETISDKKVYWLEQTAGMDYFLRSKNGKEETIKKIGSREAKKLDMEFASRFLRCQYEIPSIVGDCQVTLRLVMKGEGQEICQKDDKKSQEILAFLSELQKRF
jgi:hypothetical protein